MRERAARQMICATGLGERLLRGIVAIVAASFAAGMGPTDPALASLAGVLALGIAVMAITGWCPGAVTISASTTAEPSLRDVPDARDITRITITTNEKSPR